MCPACWTGNAPRWPTSDSGSWAAAAAVPDRVLDRDGARGRCPHRDRHPLGRLLPATVKAVARVAVCRRRSGCLAARAGCARAAGRRVAVAADGVAARGSLGLSFTLILSLALLASSWSSRSRVRRAGRKWWSALPAAAILVAVEAISLHDAVAEANRLLARRRLPRRGARAGQDLRRRGLVRRVRRDDGPRQFRASGRAVGSGVRAGRGHHGGAVPGCHHRAADTGGARHGAHAGGAGAPACVCHRAPVEYGLAAAAGLQPDQPARVRHRRDSRSPGSRC